MSVQLVQICEQPLNEFGQCPEGALYWRELPAYAFDLPPVQQLQEAFQAGLTAFFYPTIIIVFAAWAVRLILDQVS